METGSKEGARDLWQVGNMTFHQIFAAREFLCPVKFSPLFWSTSPQANHGLHLCIRLAMDKKRQGPPLDITQIWPGAKIGLGLIGEIRRADYSGATVYISRIL